jgi:hypothetical protein
MFRQRLTTVSEKRQTFFLSEFTPPLIKKILRDTEVFSYLNCRAAYFLGKANSISFKIRIVFSSLSTQLFHLPIFNIGFIECPRFYIRITLA